MVNSVLRGTGASLTGTSRSYARKLAPSASSSRTDASAWWERDAEMRASHHEAA